MIKPKYTIPIHPATFPAPSAMYAELAALGTVSSARVPVSESVQSVGS